MNKTFKVARSLTRGTVVTSEKASSYQGKAVKTVIAAAVASLVAGAAMAADPVKTTEITSSTQDQVTKLEQGYNGLTIDTQVSDKNSGKNYGAVYINGVDLSAEGSVVKGASFTGNTTYTKAAEGSTTAQYGQGGAVAAYNSKLVFENAKIADNTAQGHGGAFVLKKGSEVTLKVTGDQNVVYAGNKAGSGYSKYEDMGGFAYIDASTLTLSAEKGSTLTIGAADAAKTAGLDSIASFGSGSDKVVVEGDVTVNGSMEWFAGNITTTAGTNLTMATGFGSRVTAQQVAANSSSNDAAGNSAAITNGSKLTVVKDASVTINDVLEITGQTQNSGAGTTVEVQSGGKFVVDGIKVTSYTYADKDVGTKETAGKGVTTKGIGEVNVSGNGSATVTKDVVIDGDSQLSKTGTGTLNILGTVSTAAAVASGANTPAITAGLFNVSGGTVKAATVANAGTTSIASGAKLEVTGTGSTNTGSIAGSGSLNIANGADLVNTGSIGSTDLVVTGTLTNYTTKTDASGKSTNTYGKVSNGTTVTIENGGVVNTAIGADKYFAKSTTINEGGTFNLTELNLQSNPNATTKVYDQLLVAGNSEIVLNGGAVTLNGAAYNDGLIQIGSTEEVKDNTTKRVYTGGTLTIAQGDYTAQAVVLQGAESGTNASSTAKLAIQKGASYTVETLKVTKGDSKKYETTGYVTVDGDLTVTKTLATAEATNGASQSPQARFTIGKTGKLIVSAEALDLSINSSGQGTLASGADFTAGSLTNHGTIAVTGLTGTVEKTNVSSLKGLLAASGSNGVVDFGNLSITKITNTNGNLAYDDLKSGGALEGITNAEISQLAVEGVSGKFASSTNVGKLLLTAADTTTGVEKDVTLTLNGTGNLVSYTSGSTTTVRGVELGLNASLVTTGAGAVIGKVAAASKASGSALNVQSGDLTVTEILAGDASAETGSALIDVATLSVAEGAKLAVGETRAAKAASGSTAAVTALYGAINAGTLDVEGTLDASKNVVTAASGSITGSASIKTLNLTGNLLVGDEEKAGTLVVDTVSGSGSIIADPDFVEGQVVAPSKVVVKTIGTSNTVVAAQNSLVGVGTQDLNEVQAAFQKSGFVLGDATAEGAADNVVSSVLYVNGGKTVSGSATTYATVDGKVVSTTADADVYLQGTAPLSNSIGAGTLLVIDAATVDTKGNHAVFTQTLNVDRDANVYFDNLGNGDVIKLSVNGFNGFNSHNVSFTGDMLMDVDTVEVTTGLSTSVAVSMSGTEAELADELGYTPALNVGYAYFADRVNLASSKTSSQQFADYLYTERNHDTFAHYTAAATDMAALGATTGVQTLTMDAVNQMADTVAARTSVLTQRGQGVNVWADVNGGKFEAKTLFDGAGYSSDIYSGVLGLDYQFSCNAVLGAALTIGTADTDSKNTSVSASTDSDLVGFSVYASKTFADIWNVSADIGYLQASNEVKANGYGFNYKFDQDTDAWTVGVRGEVLTKAGSVNIVPHLGLRYTAISTDGFEAGYVTDIDDQNVFQMPVGVTVSADFETNGWTIAPKFDLSVVPTLGDKDADLKLGITGVSTTDDYAVRVIDSNPVQAQLGVNATNGAWGFGLSYKLGVGSDDRMNNSFNANVRYAF